METQRIAGQRGKEHQLCSHWSRFSGPSSRFLTMTCMCAHVCSGIGVRVSVWVWGGKKAMQHSICVPLSSDSICRYNYLFNIATPCSVTFYDLSAKAHSFNSTFPSNGHFLTCFITGKLHRHLLYSQTIKYCLAQIPSWNIKQNECCSLSCVYHIILKVKT